MNSFTVPPPVALLQMITGYWLTASLRAAAQLGIADLLKAGAQDSAELAQATGTQPRALYRLLRALASAGVFAETAPQTFVNTPLSELLRRDVAGSLRGFALMNGDEWNWRAWEKLDYSLRTGEPASLQLYPHAQNVFDIFVENPAFGANFNEAMTGFTRQNYAAAVETYDFSGFSQIVDVGGGHGVLLAALLQANPHLQGVLYDRPHVVQGNLLAQAGVAERCVVRDGDFFAEVPAGGDAYIASRVIHDWDDAQALTILQNIRRAITPHGKLLLIEMVLPPGNEPHFGKWLDVEILVASGGHERTEAEYRALCAAAGFELTRVVPTAAPVSVLEARVI